MYKIFKNLLTCLIVLCGDDRDAARSLSEITYATASFNLKCRLQARRLNS